VLAAHLSPASDAEGTRALWCALRAELRMAPPLTVGDLALDGRDLIRMGMKPGPHFRELLDGLLRRVLEDPSLNTRDALAALVRERLAAGAPEAAGDGPDPHAEDAE
jgi:hypothetical protein